MPEPIVIANDYLVCEWGALKKVGESDFKYNEELTVTHYEGQVEYEGIEFFVYADEVRDHLGFTVASPHLKLTALAAGLFEELRKCGAEYLKLKRERGEKDA